MPFVHLVDPMSQALPQWAIGLVLFVVCTLALEAGNWFGRWQRAQRSGTAETTHSSDAKDYIVSSVFRLLALLLGITFAMALDRFDSRVDWTAEEATALRTTYFRAEMLNEPHRSRLQATLREYARARLVPDDASRGELIRVQTRNEQLRARLFRDAQAAVSSAQEPWMTSGFIHTMETALQIGARRALAARIPMPSQVIDMLLLYLIVSIGVLGYLLGLEETHRRYASNFVIALFVLAILLIIDIDRPRSGPIKVSNLALEDLIRELDAAAAHREPGVSQVPSAGSRVRAENER